MNGCCDEAIFACTYVSSCMAGVCVSLPLLLHCSCYTDHQTECIEVNLIHESAKPLKEERVRVWKRVCVSVTFHIVGREVACTVQYSLRGIHYECLSPFFMRGLVSFIFLTWKVSYSYTYIINTVYHQSFYAHIKHFLNNFNHCCVSNVFIVWHLFPACLK